MIYCVTLNPALDQIIEVEDKIRPGNNNLIRKSTIDVGGKGTHVSIALSLLEEKSVCTGISGEIYYNELQDNLKEFGVEGDFVTIHNQAVRKNLILIDESDQSSLLLTEKGHPITEFQVDQLFNEKLSYLSQDDLVVVAGNPCKDTTEATFEYFFKKLVESQAKICVDLHGKFLRIALKYPLFFAKPNQFEFSDFVNKSFETQSEVVDYLKNNEIKNISTLSVSLGKQGSVLKNKDKLYRFDALPIKTINDTGSGDAYYAGIIYGLANNQDIVTSGCLATAMGAAKAEERISSGFKVDRVKELVKKVNYREVSENI